MHTDTQLLAESKEQRVQTNFVVDYAHSRAYSTKF